MFQSCNTPVPPHNVRSSKRKSPRHTPTGEGKYPHNMQAYLHDIASRSGNYSLMKKKNHPLKLVNTISPLSPENAFDYRNSDSDDEGHTYESNGVNCNINENDYGDNTTARVLFEKNSNVKHYNNELSPNRFHEFYDSPPVFTGPNNIILEHTMTKRGRVAHFVIRKHIENHEALFSVHVHGRKQRYSFQVPPSQELRVLLKLWDRHPPSMDFRCIAQNIIKSTSVSFTGQHIDSILFKDEGFSLKIKKEAIQLLTHMAIIIQKYVRRYLVLQTSLHHAHKVAMSFLPPQRYFPRNCNDNPASFSPSLLQYKYDNVSDKPHFDADNKEDIVDSHLIEDAIKAQKVAEEEVEANCKHLENARNDIHNDPNCIAKKEPSVSFSDRPDGQTHAEKVATLLEERTRAEVRERTEILAKKKKERQRNKALKSAEKKQREIDAKKKDNLGSIVRVAAIGMKLKGKALKARRVVDEEALAAAKVLEEEEAAKIKALQNIVLSHPTEPDVPKNPTFKEFYVKRAQDMAKLKGHTKEKQNFKQLNEPKDLDDLEGGVNVDELAADELFRLKLKQNEYKERQIMSGIKARSKKKEEKEEEEEKEKKREMHTDTEKEKRKLAQPQEAAGGVEEQGRPKVLFFGDDTRRELKKFDDKLPPHLFDQYFNALKEKEQEEIAAVFKQIESNAFLNQSSIHAVESDVKVMSWADTLFVAILQCKDNMDVVLAGLKIAAMFPFDRLPFSEHKIGFCGIISKVLHPHVEFEDYCTEVLQYGAKFTSKKNVHNLEQAVENGALEIILKILLKYGQKRDVIGNAPKIVVTCLKYLRNVCVASSSFNSKHVQTRLMAAGVGSCQVKLLVFYRTDEAVVASVCRTVASLVQNTSYLTQFASLECIHLYVLILKTNPMNKTIAKAVGVLLIEIYNVDPGATKEIFLESGFANLLNSLLLAQKELSSRFSLSVIECNIMMVSFFITKVNYLTPEFLRLDVVTTLQQYQQNQQNFGNNIDVVIQKCLKHLTSAAEVVANKKK